METEGLLTIQEAAQKLGVADNTVRIATKEGRLPSQYVFGRKVIRADDLEAYRQRTRPNNQKPAGRPKGSKQIREKTAQQNIFEKKSHLDETF